VEFFYLRSGREYVTMDSFTSYAFSVSIISLFTYIIEFSSPSTSSWNFTPFLTRGIHGERSLQYIH